MTRSPIPHIVSLLVTARKTSDRRAGSLGELRLQKTDPDLQGQTPYRSTSVLIAYCYLSLTPKSASALLSHYHPQTSIPHDEALLPTPLLPVASPRLPPSPMRPLWPTSLPPRPLRLMVSTTFINSIIAIAIAVSPRRRSAPRPFEPTVRLRQSLARHRRWRRRAGIFRSRRRRSRFYLTLRGSMSLTDELWGPSDRDVEAVWVVWVG